MTIRSMTGFGAAEGEISGGRLAVEVRSVNHRFFTPSLKLPTALARWEGDAREVLRRRVNRGHVTLSSRFTGGGDAAGGARIDEERFAAYLEQLRAVASRHGIAAPIDVGTVIRLPDVVRSGEALVLDDPAPFLTLVESATEAMDAMRASEGAGLARFLDERLAVMERAMAAVATRAPARLTEQRDRLRAAVRELTEGLAVDEQRLAQEIAILADRLDVSEEIHRFSAHLGAFRATLASPPKDGVGKRLGFLLQELLREANTTGSKGNDSEILPHVIVVKEELERIREQVENLE